MIWFYIGLIVGELNVYGYFFLSLLVIILGAFIAAGSAAYFGIPDEYDFIKRKLKG